MFRLVRRGVAASAAMVLGVVAFAQESTFETLPEDMVVGIAIDDMTALQNKWNESRFADAWNSDEFTSMREVIEKWLEEGFEEIAADAELDDAEKEMLNPARLAETFPGFVALYSTHMEQRVSGDVQLSEYDVCLVAEVPEEKREDVEKLIDLVLEDVPANADKRLEDFGGTTIHIVSFTEEEPAENAPDGLEGLGLSEEITTEYQYAFTDDWFVFAEGPEEPAKKAINALTNDDARRMGDVGGLRALSGKTDGLGDVTVWLNFPLLYESLKNGSEGEEVERVFSGLGVDNMGAVLATASLTNEGLRQRFALQAPRERSGLFSMLYAGEPNSVSLASRVPVDAREFYSWTLDLADFWSAMREMIVAMNPQADGMISFGLMTTKSNMGIDVEQDVLPRITGEHAYYTRPPQAVKDSPVTDEQEMPVQATGLLLGTTGGDETAVMFNGIMEKMQEEPISQPLESSTVGSTTVWTLPEDGEMFPGTQPPAWGFTSSFALFASSMQEMQGMMRSLDGENVTLAAKPEFRRALDGVERQDLRVFNWSSADSYGTMVDELRWLFDTMASDGEFELSPEDVPPVEWWKRYFGYAVMTAHAQPGYILSDYQLTTTGE